MFKFLLSKKAEVKANSYGHTILHYAASYDNVDLCRFILNQEEYKNLLEARTHEELQTPLHYCAKRGKNKAIVYFFSNFRAKIDKEIRDSLGN
jgi:ankyrin repeat protein